MSFLIENPATGVAISGMAYAEANWGRWIARCPRPFCTNAMRVFAGQAAFRCDGPGSCGWEAPLSWPADPEAIEELLAMRPVTNTQNWAPGETLEELLSENATHGCLPAAWLAVKNRALVLATTNGRVTGGMLHDQLVAAGRREIGA